MESQMTCQCQISRIKQQLFWNLSEIGPLGKSNVAMNSGLTKFIAIKKWSAPIHGEQTENIITPREAQLQTQVNVNQL